MKCLSLRYEKTLRVRIVNKCTRICLSAQGSRRGRLSLKTLLKSATHVSVVVQLIVGQFQLVEGNGLFHPMSPARRTVGMHVDSRG